MHHGTIKNRVGVVGPPIHISTAGFVGSSVVTDANPAADVNILVGRVGRPTARTYNNAYYGGHFGLKTSHP